MQRYNAKHDMLNINGIILAYGLDKMPISEPSPNVTYVYTPRGGKLDTMSGIVDVPTRSVVVIAEMHVARFDPASKDLECVVLRAPRALPHPTDDQMEVMRTNGLYFKQPDTTEWHDRIATYANGAIHVFPKYKEDGTKVRGWPVNSKKGVPLSIDGAAEWTEIREAERYHFHHLVKEVFIGLHGIGTLRVDGASERLQPGHVLVMEPGDKHCVSTITPGKLGFYSHLVVQYPPVENDKVVVD